VVAITKLLQIYDKMDFVNLRVFIFYFDMLLFYIILIKKLTLN